MYEVFACWFRNDEHKIIRYYVRNKKQALDLTAFLRYNIEEFEIVELSKRNKVIKRYIDGEETNG